MLGGNLQGEAFAHVASQAHVQPCALQYVVGEQRGGGFAVAAGDAHHLGVGVTAGKLNLRNHWDVFGVNLLHDWSLVGYARALDYLVGREYFLFGVLFFFPLNAVVVKKRFVFVLDGSHVAKPYFKALCLGEHSGTRTAFSAA